jgi:hypothetical protein
MIANKGSIKRVISVEAGYCNPGRSRNVNTLNTASNGRNMIFNVFPPRQVLLIGYLSISLFSLQGCFSEQSRQMIERVDLVNALNNLQVGQVLPLRKLVKVPVGLVCVLYPYQDRVAKNSKESARINDYLRFLEYMGEESSWSLLIVEPAKISLSRFDIQPFRVIHDASSAKRLDILPFSRMHDVSRRKLTKNIAEAPDCFPLETAVVAKIVADKLDNSAYLILGEKK